MMMMMMRGANEGTLNDPRNRFRSHNNRGQIKERKEGIVLFATYEFLACHRRLLLLLWWWTRELMGGVVVVVRMRK
jgi:hypothetical protein